MKWGWNQRADSLFYFNDREGIGRPPIPTILKRNVEIGRSRFLPYQSGIVPDDQDFPPIFPFSPAYFPESIIISYFEI